MSALEFHEVCGRAIELQSHCHGPALSIRYLSAFRLRESWPGHGGRLLLGLARA
jgi:hypothetical protein